LGEKLGEKQLTLFRLMSQHPDVTQKEMTEALGVSTTAVGNNIRFVKSQGYLKNYPKNRTEDSFRLYWKEVAS
jgi:predicted transcriptional regulator